VKAGWAGAAARFLEPPAEYGVFTTWFWNDELREAELLRQLRAFAAAGFGGVMIHARVGLSRRIGYLTPEWFRLARLAAEEAARLGMKVMLYDEGSYPSGSAQGRVAAENPDFASRCLIPVSREVAGPADGYWRPNPGRALRDQVVSVAIARETGGGALDPGTLEPLTIEGHGLVRYDVPAGAWRLVSVWSAFSGARIRGVFPEEDDGHALAPAAGDIMAPEAVACFIRHTHDRYAETLGDLFGTTVVALFTDEPNALGRSPQRGPGPVPWTPGFLEDLRGDWRELSGSDDVETWLPALWFDLGGKGESMRELYRRAAERRVRRVFYGAQRKWCEAHGLALTGHPSASGDLQSLDCFHWPGQDMVWRYVEPGRPSALEGEHSVAAKVAGSAAALAGKPRASAEVFGAYGWRLSADEMKWLLDWHLVRGVNCIIPHASFYSIRGRRAYESEPDFGVHSSLWPAIGALARYARRVCALLAGGREVCDVAVLTDPERAAWSAAAELYRGQVDFLYVDAAAIAGGEVRGGALRVGPHAFRAVVCDGAPAIPVRARERLRAHESAGGLVLERWRHGGLAAAVRAHHEPDVVWSGDRELRVLHVERSGIDVYLLANEGESRIDGELALRGGGRLELWDPWTGLRHAWSAEVRGGRRTARLDLARRASVLLVLGPGAEPGGGARDRAGPGESMPTPAIAWRPEDPAGSALALPAPGDWAQVDGFRTFTGTVVYRGVLELDAAQAREARFLDLGAVGEIAEVEVNGQGLGVSAWAPYVVPVEGSLRAGENRVELRVSNSMANAYDGLELPSGLMGPVVLRRSASP
jgi:hypothetical protein